MRSFKGNKSGKETRAYNQKETLDSLGTYNEEKRLTSLQDILKTIGTEGSI